MALGPDVSNNTTSFIFRHVSTINSPVQKVTELPFLLGSNATFQLSILSNNPKQLFPIKTLEQYVRLGLLGNLGPVHFTKYPFSRQSKAQCLTPRSSQKVKVRFLADRNDAVADPELFFIVERGL